jgi:hypothetical protein
VANDGRVFVGDGYCNARVVEFSAGGECVGEYALPAASGPPLQNPHSVVLQECARALYVAEREASRVHRFGLESRKLEGLRAPRSIAPPLTRLLQLLFSSFSAPSASAGLLLLLCWLSPSHHFFLRRLSCSVAAFALLTFFWVFLCHANCGVAASAVLAMCAREKAGCCLCCCGCKGHLCCRDLGSFAAWPCLRVGGWALWRHSGALLEQGEGRAAHHCGGARPRSRSVSYPLSLHAFDPLRGPSFDEKLEL